MNKLNWQQIATELYEIVCRTWCWHCGAGTTRDYRTDELIDQYRVLMQDQSRYE